MDKDHNIYIIKFKDNLHISFEMQQVLLSQTFDVFSLPKQHSLLFQMPSHA